MVVLHVEPDLWGFIQNRFGDNATTVSARVSETGLPELAGLPSNVSGFARAVLRLRDTYAPNVVIGYHISVWGTGNDIILSNPPDATVDSLGSRAAAFYSSLAANFDIAFAEFSDRDAAFYQHVYGDGGQRWMDAEDFRRLARFLGRVSSTTGKRIVMWQIPLGNTKMRAVNNTWGHYQDNRPEWFLDEPSRSRLTTYRDAGVVAFVPFFLAHGLILGRLVFYTRSIVPGIILHAASDGIVLPMQYGVIPSAGDWAFVWQGWLLLLAGTAAIPAFRALAKAMAFERIDIAR